MGWMDCGRIVMRLSFCFKDRGNRRLELARNSEHGLKGRGGGETTAFMWRNDGIYVEELSDGGDMRWRNQELKARR